MYRVFFDNKQIYDGSVSETGLINPVVTLSENAAGMFKFGMPADHPYSGLPTLYNTHVYVERIEDDQSLDEGTTHVIGYKNKCLFSGRITKINVDIFGRKQIECEGDLALLNDIYLPQAKCTSVNTKWLFTNYIMTSYNSMCDSMSVINVREEDIDNYTGSTSMPLTILIDFHSCYEALMKFVVGTVGGYYYIECEHRHDETGETFTRYLHYNDMTQDEHVVTDFSLKKNIVDLAIENSGADICTSIIPLGEKMETRDKYAAEGLDEPLTIRTYSNEQYWIDAAANVISVLGRHQKVVKFEDVTGRSALRTKANAYLSSYQFADLTISVSAMDLRVADGELSSFSPSTRIGLSSTIHVVSPPHGLDTNYRVSSMVINLDAPEKDSYILGGTHKYRMSNRMADIKRATSRIKQIKG